MWLARSSLIGSKTVFILLLTVFGLVLGACGTLEEEALLGTLDAPLRVQWKNEHYGPLGPYDCGAHEDAGDVRFIDEWVESGTTMRFLDRSGTVVRSQTKVNYDGWFTDIDTGYRLSYKGAVSIRFDYAAETVSYTGLEYKIVNEDGKIVGRNIGRWIWGTEGLVKGAGHQDFTSLICGFFPQA